MNYMGISKTDVINGDGIRVVLWVAGCGHHCEDCQNPETWNKNAGKLYTGETQNEIIGLLKRDFISGITLSGGDPLFPDNRKCVTDLCKEIKKEFPNKTIWCYTGYTIDQLKGSKEQQIIKQLDVLVDGKFEKHLNDETCRFKGSANQKIYYFKNGVVSKIG